MNDTLAEDLATGWEPSSVELGVVYLVVIIMVFIVVAVSKRDYRRAQEERHNPYWDNVEKAPHDTTRKHQRRN